MTNTEVIRKAFKFPFEFRPFQAAIVDEYGQNNRHGYYDEAGSGKTITSAAHALLLTHLGRVDQWLVVMPPILIPNWARVLGTIINEKTGKPVTALPYAGTPTERAKLDLSSAQFLLMSYDILKRDFEYLFAYFGDRAVGGICDEAHKIKNIESQTHKAIKLMFEGQPLFLLSGTPVTQPDDSYAYIRFTNVGAYRNMRHFRQLHVKEVDEYEKVIAWQNTDLLSQNLLVNATRSLKADHLKELPPVQYNPVFYDLDPKHYKLYRQVADDHLVELESGGVIEALNASKLMHCLQQLIVNWGHFSEDPSRRPAGLDLVEQVLDEIGTNKLLLVVNYRLSNDLLFAALTDYNPTRLYGGMGPKKQQAELEKFIGDPTSRVMVINPEAAGYGIDGLQHVCSDILFLECPSNPKQFFQTTARLDRSGQLTSVNCRLAVANKTLQVKRHKQLLVNDELVNTIQGSHADLREMIYGG